MKHLYILLILIITIGTNSSFGQGCDPAINGFSFSLPNCFNNNTATLSVEWGMSGLDSDCVAPANSFLIQINLPASEVYGVNSIADVTTPSSFDWTLLNPYTLEGVNNVDINWLEQGEIIVEVVPKVANACILLESNSNIVINSSGPPYFGSPGNFDNDDDNDSLFDQLGVSVVVPVKLVSFEAVNLDCDQNKLEWATGSEINNAGFEIQRSADAVHFEEIGFVEPTDIMKDGVREYRFVDDKLEGDRQYFYRIKQIDLDGQYEIFDIKTVEVTCDKDIIVTLFPNPAIDELNFKITGDTSGDIDLTIHSVDGKLVKHISSSSRNEIIDISDLDAGMYLLKTKTTTGFIEENFIKID